MQWHPFAEKFPLLEGEEWEAFKKSIQETKGPLEPITYRMVKGKKEGLDGRNRLRACRDLHIACRDKLVRCPDDEVKTYIIRRNVHRRHLSAEFRRSIVLDLHEEGKSQRQIAETLGVSVGTVNHDIQSGVQNRTPENGQPKTVTGKDKKQYPARQLKPRTLCDRCQRVGVVKNCPACKELRGGKARQPGEDDKPNKNRPKQGEVLFDFKEFEADFGRLLRQVDKLGKAYKCKESATAELLRKTIVQWMHDFKDWAKEAKKEHAASAK